MSVPDHRAQTQQGYDAIAVNYARLLPALNAETSLDIAMIDGFADRCASTRLGPVADAGCGTGRVSAHLAARGLDVVGIDLSPAWSTSRDAPTWSCTSRSARWKNCRCRTPAWVAWSPGTPSFTVPPSDCRS